MEEKVNGEALVRKRKEGTPLEHRHKAQSIIMSKSLDQLENEVALGFYENVSLHAGSKKRVFALEVLYGLIWWTSFHGLTPFLAQPSLMALPHSLASFSVPASLLLSPLLLSVGTVRNCVCSPFGLLLLRLAGLSSLSSHHLDSPGSRLLAINVGMASNVLVLCGYWWDLSQIDRYRKVHYFFLGFLLHLSSRVWLSTFSLAFVGSPLDKAFMVLAALIILSLYRTDYRTPVLHKKEVKQFAATSPPTTRTEEDSHPHGWVWSGVGFGALLFVMQSLFGDAALIPRWVGLMTVTTGDLLETSTLLEHIGSVMIVAALSCGVLLSGDVYVRLLCSLPWLGLSIIGLLILTQLSYITAFLGGIHLATYTSSLWLQLCRRLIESPLHKTVFIASLTYLTLISLAAVEGRVLGVSLLDCCLFFAMCLMGGSLKQWMVFVESAKKPRRPSKPVNLMKLRRKPSYIMILGKVVRKLSTITESQLEEVMASEEEDDEDSGLSMHDIRLQQLLECEESEIKKFNNKLKKVLLIVCMATVIGSAYNYHPIAHPAGPSDQGEVGVSVGGWQINAGYDLQGHPSVARSVEILREAGPDVLCLYDVMKPFSGDFDSSLWITTELQMSAVRLPPSNQVVLMSRLPLVQSAIFTNSTTGNGVYAELVVGSQSLHVFCLQNKPLKSGSPGGILSVVEVAVSSGHPTVLVHHSPVANIAQELEYQKLHLFSEVSRCDEGTTLHFSKLSRENHTCVDSQNTAHRDMFLARFSLERQV